MSRAEFRDYLIELYEEELTPAELADKIIETLECHPLLFAEPRE